MGEEFLTLDDFDLRGESVLVRVDINSPIDPSSGRILNDSRIRSHVETLQDLEESKTVIMAHQSRPGKADFTTLKAHADRLSYLLGKRVGYVDSLFGSKAIGAIEDMHVGDMLILENTRMFSEEIILQNRTLAKQSRSHIVRSLAPHMDFFVHDAFAAAHRSQPSLVGFSEVLTTIAGRVMEKELDALNRFLGGVQKPNAAILGGVKADDSIDIARNLLERGVADKVLTTGMVGNLFLIASGVDVGEANLDLVRKELDDYESVLDEARSLLEKFKGSVEIPKDVVVNRGGKRKGMRVEDLPSDELVSDIGLDTIVHFADIIGDSKTAIMNGPAGIFEVPEFSIGTSELLRAMAYSDAYTIIGGGHTIAAAEYFDIAAKMDHVSTGGGSLMEFLSGKTLPGIEVLKKWKKRSSSSSGKS
ncbi:MAG: phosphoglycerate kinase [Candidatus Thermoplasmatota archaeon]|nr:phosphoglycerate kinase [Candidatus Thermoplasmatota archaeon]